ncbi:YbaB/EbfC family nucleoid-associated protein [Micromonospora zhanjiangensis]|uniref:YbaB/EbfC family nucleoid-associated protein n=1 Tax=Micromonospora zhanjiangensis TaxID=1522057 RepID=A0ABV8KL00_9ACTN
MEQQEPLIDALDRLTGVGRSEDGLVLARVDAAGLPTEIHIEPAGMRMSSGTLGTSIIAAIRAAHEDLQAQASAAVRAQVDQSGSTFGVGSIEASRADLARQVEQVTEEARAIHAHLLDRLDRM